MRKPQRLTIAWGLAALSAVCFLGGLAFTPLLVAAMVFGFGDVAYMLVAAAMAARSSRANDETTSANEWD